MCLTGHIGGKRQAESRQQNLSKLLNSPAASILSTQIFFILSERHVYATEHLVKAIIDFQTANSMASLFITALILVPGLMSYLFYLDSCL